MRWSCIEISTSLDCGVRRSCYALGHSGWGRVSDGGEPIGTSVNYNARTMSRPVGVAADVGSLTMTFQGFVDPYYGAERGTLEVLTDLPIRDTSEEIRAHVLKVGRTLIRTQQTKDRSWRGFAVPIEPWRRLINWDAAQRALP